MLNLQKENYCVGMGAIDTKTIRLLMNRRVWDLCINDVIILDIE